MSQVTRYIVVSQVVSYIEFFDLKTSKNQDNDKYTVKILFAHWTAQNCVYTINHVSMS